MYTVECALQASELGHHTAIHATRIMQVTKELGKEFRPVTIDELEGKQRRDLESQLIKDDVRRHEARKAGDLPALPGGGPGGGGGDRDASSRRFKMMLPAPALAESEYAQVRRETRFRNSMLNARRLRMHTRIRCCCDCCVDNDITEASMHSRLRCLLIDIHTAAREPAANLVAEKSKCR